MKPSSDLTEEQRIINEAATLMQATSFSTLQGDFLAGESVNILIDPRWNKEGSYYQLLITCHALENCKVSWKGMPVMIKSISDSSAPIFIARLGNRGQTVLNNILAGSYQISLSAQWYFSEEQIIRPAKIAPIRHRGKPEQSEDPGQTPNIQSNDSRISVKTEQSSPGRVSLVFETNHKELDGAKIHFAIALSTGEVVITDDVKLSEAMKNGIWRGSWERELILKEACHLMFEILSE